MSKDVNEPHRIRLAGPWLRTVVGGGPAESKKVTMPCRVNEDLGSDFYGVVEYQRSFNCPTGLDDTTTVRLSFVELRGVASVTLNGVALDGVASSSDVFDVTNYLDRQNDLRIRIRVTKEDRIGDNANQALGLVGEVRLEIS